MKIIFIFFIIYHIFAVLAIANDNLTNNYIDNLSKIIEQRYYIPYDFSKKILSSLNIDNKTLEKIVAPKEALIWGKYKDIFVTEKRINDAKAFLKEHLDILRKIENEFKVDKEIIVALVAIESNFGKYKPVHNVGDALFTLAKEYPPRSNFFTKELIHYIILRRLDKTYDNNNIKGSYAGAIGLPQFMPSSILSYAVDYDNDCKIDLLNNWPDTFASIANYLKSNGWEFNELIATKVRPEHVKTLENFVNQKLSLDIKTLSYPSPKKNTASIKKFSYDNNTYELWITYKNFDVIKTYNRSDNYALSATLIVEALKNANKE
ncbi:MAG: lytic murein transglycosylase [Calditerrivibrio sp.]|nr:lytic murein transglycosylase [Calditerrivibrio sp.]